MSSYRDPPDPPPEWSWTLSAAPPLTWSDWWGSWSPPPTGFLCGWLRGKSHSPGCWSSPGKAARAQQGQIRLASGESLKHFVATYVRGNAASAAAGRWIGRLQLTDHLLQLSRQLQVCARAELQPQVLQAVDGNVLPGLNQAGMRKNNMIGHLLLLSALHSQPSHPAGGDGVLEHTADNRS